MGLGDALKKFVAPEVDDGEIELEENEAQSLSQYEKPKVEGASNISSSAKIALFEPRSFEEGEEIGAYLKENKACCINLHRMPSDYRQRIIDFLSGVVYGVDGTIKKIGENVILISPRNLQVGGDITFQGNEF